MENVVYARAFTSDQQMELLDSVAAMLAEQGTNTVLGKEYHSDTITTPSRVVNLGPVSSTNCTKVLNKTKL